MKKIIALVLCIVLTLSFAACTAGNKDNKKSNAQTGSKAQIAKSLTSFDTIDDAAKAAGFEVTAPDEISGKKLTLIQGIKNASETGYNTISLTYGDSKITLRKGKGADDVSGDYNDYADIGISDVGGKSITQYGIDLKVYKAIWTDGDFSYSITAENGLSSEEIDAIAAKLA